MGGSPDIPQTSASQLELERKQAALLDAQLAAAQKPIEIPKAADPLPPSVRQSTADVQGAADEARRKAASRTNTQRKTIFAGETGGYNAGVLGSKTLLG